MKIVITHGDITKMNVDAIVNAARPSLLGGGGVDGAIHAAAGPGLKAACAKFPEKEPGIRCYPGDAFRTKGFLLPARYVIHTVGPVFQTDIPLENAVYTPPSKTNDLLYKAYYNSLALADQTGCKTIAFPAISCGVYGCPLELGMTIAFQAFHAWNWYNIEEISMVLFTDLDYETAKIVFGGLDETT